MEKVGVRERWEEGPEFTVSIKQNNVKMSRNSEKRKKIQIKETIGLIH